MKRFIITTVTVILCFLLQTTVFQSLALAGEVPNLMLVVVVAIAYMRGKKEGMYVGFASGMLIDLIYGDLIGMNAVLMVLVGYLVGICNEIYYRDQLSVPIVLVGVSDFLFNFVFYIFNFLLRGRFHVLYYIWYTILPEMVYTVLVACVLYKVLHSINYRLECKEDTEEVL
ncbi:MAG: rod shape-determining protein MreD [Lachnospiraceae bacterium]|jgi:rod shape-determining protein MreD|nr:rod shape-determining protein MreD [Lachnospiraceae bacterium]